MAEAVPEDLLREEGTVQSGQKPFRVLAEPDSAVDLQHLTVNDLRLLLAARSRPASGSHGDLVKRLAQDLRGNTREWQWVAHILGSAQSLPNDNWNSFVYNGDIYIICDQIPQGMAGNSEPVRLAHIMKYSPKDGGYEIIDEVDELQDFAEGIPHHLVHMCSCGAPKVYGDELYVFGQKLEEYYHTPDEVMPVHTFNFQTREWSLCAEQGGNRPGPRECPECVVHKGTLLMFGYSRHGNLWDEWEHQPEARDTLRPPPDNDVYCFDFATRIWSALDVRGECPADPMHVYALASWRDYMFALSFTSEAGFCIHRLNIAALAWEDVTPQRGPADPRCSGGFIVVQFREHFVVHGGFDDRGQLSGAMWLFSLQHCMWSGLRLPAACCLPRTRHGLCAAGHALVIIGGHLIADRELAEEQRVARHPVMALQLAPVPRPDAAVGAAAGVLMGLQAARHDAELADVTLRAGALEQRCHRAVLAIHSPFLRRLFLAGLREGATGEARLEVTAAVLDALVSFCYGTLRDVGSDLLVDLFKAAHMYEMEGLKEFCVAKIMADMDTTNAANCMRLALRFNVPDLEAHCIALASVPANWMRIADSPGFLQLLCSDPEAAQKFIVATANGINARKRKQPNL